jgi:hypothetical protein
MRTLFLVLATSATIFATGATPVAARDRVTPVAASEYEPHVDGLIANLGKAGINLADI